MENYILVVEDDPLFQQMLVDLVEVANCKCVVADNGAIA